jgi:hypothetical protein
MLRILPFFFIALFIILPAMAKPVTWEDGWQIMQMNDPDMNALHVMYTVTPTFSVQNRADYMRDDDIFVGGLQVNYLLKRWNFPQAQGNIYVSGGGGMARDDTTSEAAWFGSLLADYETRSFFISYEADGITSDQVSIFVYPGNQPAATAGPDQQLCSSSPASLCILRQ